MVEIKAKTQQGSQWMAFAIWVPTRLWMGGVMSPKRDMALIQSLADKVRQIALCRPLLLAVDGLVSYVSAFHDAFRSKFPRQDGEIGRCKMVSWPDIYIVQVVKQPGAILTGVQVWQSVLLLSEYKPIRLKSKSSK